MMSVILCFLFLVLLNGKDACGVKGEVKSEEELLLDVKDDGSSLISKSMVEEEEKLLEARIKEEEAQCEAAPDLTDTQFNKLDELLTQTKLYSEFLLEKMDDITLVLLFSFVPLFCVNFLCLLILLLCSYCLNFVL